MKAAFYIIDHFAHLLLEARGHAQAIAAGLMPSRDGPRDLNDLTEQAPHEGSSRSHDTLLGRGATDPSELEEEPGIRQSEERQERVVLSSLESSQVVHEIVSMSHGNKYWP